MPCPSGAYRRRLRDQLALAVPGSPRPARRSGPGLAVAAASCRSRPGVFWDPPTGAGVVDGRAIMVMALWSPGLDGSSGLAARRALSPTEPGGAGVAARLRPLRRGHRLGTRGQPAGGRARRRAPGRHLDPSQRPAPLPRGAAGLVSGQRRLARTQECRGRPLWPLLTARGEQFRVDGGSFDEDARLHASEYAAHGGAFPVLVRGTGCVGTVAVSGLPRARGPPARRRHPRGSPPRADRTGALSAGRRPPGAAAAR